MSTVDDPASTQRRPALGIEAELDAEGFEGAELIGRGGFGTVYRCLKRALDRQVAIKVLRVGPRPGDIDRFLREQRTLGKLSGHPNIVTVLHADVTATGRPFLVMPYHSRGLLAEILRTRGPLPSRTDSDWASSSRAHWRRHTATGYCTVTSSPETSSSPTTGNPSCATSASPTSPADSKPAPAK